MSHKVNIDFISCVSKCENGELMYKEVAVEKKNKDILAQMTDMIEKPKYSLLDLQRLTAKMILSDKKHDVCIPHAYNSAFIHSPRKPSNISASDYHKMLAQKEDELIKKKENENARDKDSFISDKMALFVKGLKQQYVHELHNYVDADEYSEQLSQIRQDADYLMYSTEKIGWTLFNYRISDVINIEVKTNFGYGRSSYFYVNLTYKGIKIIPYADIVKYYYANMRDYGRYTRQYYPHHENWPVSLNFVVETANLAHENPDEFVRVWIKNELDEMMTGLRRLKNNAHEVINYFGRNSNNNAGHYIAVRNIQGEELRDYKAFPREMATAYKAYKITGALHFLENMTELSQLCDFVDESIKELKALNRSIIPEIRETVESINTTLAGLRKDLQKFEAKLSDNDKLLDPMEAELSALLESKDREEWANVRMEFHKTHPQMEELQQIRRDLKSEIINIENLIRKRQNFKDSLSESLHLINENTIPSDACK